MEEKDELTRHMAGLRGKGVGGTKDTIRLSLIQMGSKENDRDANVEKACGYIEKAMEGKPDIILLPEFFNIEYFLCNKDPKYFDYAEKDDGRTITKVSEKARKHKVHIVATIYEYVGPGVYFDTAMVINPSGEIIGKFRKVHPAAVRSLEKIYFKRGSRFPVFDILGWKVGITICYDNLFPETVRCVSVNGAELVLAPFATAPIPFWDAILITRAVENGIYYAACNKVGREMPGDWVNFGRSAIVSPMGEILSQAGEEKDEIISAELNKAVVAGFRNVFPVYRDRRPEAYTDLCRFLEDQRGLL